MSCLALDLWSMDSWSIRNYVGLKASVSHSKQTQDLVLYCYVGQTKRHSQMPPVQSCVLKVTPGPVQALHLLNPSTLYPSMDSKPSSVTTGSLGVPLVTAPLWHVYTCACVCVVGAVCPVCPGTVTYMSEHM